ncbi:exopolyphosphatase [Periweissella cryptocerci]|uniref:Exopolyphosphatase n=1 Tax=Periweissella cryptocerci TaxID=2506420 RepID=A0A4P6YTU3_9LACO|nr:exopolyphosphatase [Periweissella cryptocerci]QBO36121.1 exopolyphosphatase [Periweissella cryptocerci]
MAYLTIMDLGSNSTRMVVEDIKADGTYTEIIRVKDDTRMSEGMGAEKILQTYAMDRVITALLKFKAMYVDLEDVTVRAITTAAVRQATNQQEFLDRVKAEVGLDVQVLSGDDEAYYDYLGASQALSVKDAMLLDTGGASVELVLIKDGKKSNLISIPFGAVNLSEQFQLGDVISAAKLFDAARFIQKQYSDVAWFGQGFNLPIVLLGGANRTLARIDRTQQAMTRIQDFHGYRMAANRVLDLFREMIALDLAERLEIPGLEAERADIIVGGFLPLVMMISMLDSDRIIFSESGVREGLIAEYVQGNFTEM